MIEKSLIILSAGLVPFVLISGIAIFFYFKDKHDMKQEKAE